MEQTFKDYEILIIDAHSSDRTVDIAKKYPVRIIYEEGKKSYGRASNIGVKNALGKYVAFISADSYADKNWLKNLVETIETDNKITGVNGCHILLPIPPSKSNVLSNKRVLYTDVSRFQTVNTIAKREDLINAGCFNEFLPAAEDAELGWRIFKQGKIFVSSSAAVTYHKIHVSLKEIYTKEKKNILGIWLAFLISDPKPLYALKALYIKRLIKVFFLIIAFYYSVIYAYLLILLIFLLFFVLMYYYIKTKNAYSAFLRFEIDVIILFSAVTGFIYALIYAIPPYSSRFKFKKQGTADKHNDTNVIKF